MSFFFPPIHHYRCQMPSAYILDTNVLMGDPEAIFAFEDKKVILPIRVLRELDKHKTRQDKTGARTRRAIRNIEALRNLGKIGEGVPLENGGTFLVDTHDEHEKADDSILAVARRHEGGKLISNDIHLRCLAACYDIPTDPYERDVKEISEIYGGARVVHVAPDVIDEFYANRGVDFGVATYENGETVYHLPEHADGDGDDDPLCPHQMVVLKSGGRQSAPTRWFKGRCQPFRLPAKSDGAQAASIHARNVEQAFALDMLQDSDLPLVTLIGKAGCGKSLMAVAAGFEQAIETGDYQRFIVARPIQPLGNDIGYLPGTAAEKLEPWIAPIKDSLNVILNNADPASVDMMFEQGKIEVEALTYIRGRSIPKAYIIIDEAQNLSVEEMKAIVTRVGEGSKLVVTGDIEQVDGDRFDSQSNGLAYLVEKMRDQDVSGHITLLKGERSELATLAARIL